MITKFCWLLYCISPIRMASVMVVVAHMIDERFFRNSLVWNRRGMNL